MLVNSLEPLGFLSVFKACHQIVSLPEDDDDREVRISFSKRRPVQGQATVGSILQFANAHCSGNRLRSIAVRNKKPHSPCVIADYPNLTDCHFGVRRDRLSQKRLSDPSPNPSFVPVARDTDGAWPDASPNGTWGPRGITSTWWVIQRPEVLS